MNDVRRYIVRKFAGKLDVWAQDASLYEMNRWFPPHWGVWIIIKSKVMKSDWITTYLMTPPVIPRSDEEMQTP